MRRVAFVFLAVFCCIAAHAASDTVIVHKDARLDVLTTKQAAVNKLTSKLTSSGQYKGYRLQVVNTRSRDEAFKAKADLLQMFPQQKVYMLYQSPYFKIRIGNFMQRADALAFRAQLEKSYPQTAYVVEDVIEYTPAEDEDPTAN